LRQTIIEGFAKKLTREGKAMRRILKVFAILCLSLISTTSYAQDALESWIPPNSNAVAIIRVAELLNSPYGRRHEWVDEYKDAYAAGLLSAPPSVIEVVRATEYRPYATGAQPVFSVYSMRVDVSMSDIAKHEMTQAEKIGENFVVRSQKGHISCGWVTRCSAHYSLPFASCSRAGCGSAAGGSRHCRPMSASRWPLRSARKWP
jgi:hypothetical protein